MTLTEDIVQAIRNYTKENKRAAPLKDIVSSLASTANIDTILELVGKLKADGTLIGRRGRTGGLVVAGDMEIMPNAPIAKAAATNTNKVSQKKVDEAESSGPVSEEDEENQVAF